MTTKSVSVLVTGGQGLVGKALQEVIYTDTRSNIKYWFLSRSECDLADEHQVEQLFCNIKPNIVVHLAAKVGGVYDNLNNNYEFFIVNNKINTNVLEACRRYKVERLVNVLSTCIFPAKGITYPLTSDQLHNMPPHYSNIGYSYAKRMLHVGSELLSKQTGMDVINVIPTNLYGKDDNYNLESAHVLPALIHKAYLAKKAGLPLHIKGDGTACRQFLFANDLAKVIKHFAENKCTRDDNRQVSCIVAPPASHEIRISDVVRLITTCLNFNGKIVYETQEENGQLRKTVNDQEIRKYIPDVQFTSLNRGLSETCEYFISNFCNVRK
jgi:GDP-L-fucose synthase